MSLIYNNFFVVLSEGPFWASFVAVISAVLASYANICSRYCARPPFVCGLK